MNCQQILNITIYNFTLQPSNEKEFLFIDENIMSNGETSISEKETVQLKEDWKQSLISDDKEVQIWDGTSYDAQTTIPTSLTGIPIGVFTKEGRWASVNNPSNPYMGYYAVTYPVWGSKNFITRVIKWEYLYNPCDNLSSNSEVATDGVVGFKIIDAAEYTYYAIRDSVELTSFFIPFRIKNASIAMGLQSEEQILSYVNRGMQADGKTISVNWRSLLGLLPFGQYYSAATTLFRAIEYKDNNITTSYDYFQSTAAGQKAVYGKLVRGYKMTDNGKYFIENGDTLNISFQVRQPKDLNRTVRKNAIANKYYFEIYERNGTTLLYSQKVYTVEQVRNSYYNVY